MWQEPNTIISFITFIAVIIVGIILRAQINSQKQKIDDLEKYTNILKSTYEMLDVESVKKYIQTEKELLEQGTEVKRRAVIKSTIDRLTKEYKAKYEDQIPFHLNEMLNEFANFLVFFFTTNYKGKEDLMRADIRQMFPKSHESLIEYINSSNDEENSESKSTD